MATLETITPVVLQRLYGWGPCLDPSACSFRPSQTYVNVVLSSVGLLSLVMSAFLFCFLGEKIAGKEPLAIAFAFTVDTITNLMVVDWPGSVPAWRFVFSYCAQGFSNAVSQGCCSAVLSGIVGPHAKAKYMGSMLMVGAIPRVIGPFVLVFLLETPRPLQTADFPNVYSGPVPRTWMLYGVQAAMSFSMVLLIALNKRALAPHPNSSSKLHEPLLDDVAYTPSTRTPASSWDGTCHESGGKA